jgi:hypothetical protein
MTITMSYDETFVGSLAIIMAIVAAAIAVGPWNRPYRLRSFSAISQRFGKSVARGVWVAIAVAALTAGLAILTGLRPSYTHPAQRAELDQ